MPTHMVRIPESLEVNSFVPLYGKPHHDPEHRSHDPSSDTGPSDKIVFQEADDASSRDEHELNLATDKGAHFDCAFANLACLSSAEAMQLTVRTYEIDHVRDNVDDREEHYHPCDLLYITLLRTPSEREADSLWNVMFLSKGMMSFKGVLLSNEMKFRQTGKRMKATSICRT